MAGMILAILKAYKALTGAGGMDDAPTVLHLQHIQQSLIGFLIVGKSDTDMIFFPLPFSKQLSKARKAATILLADRKRTEPKIFQVRC